MQRVVKTPAQMNLKAVEDLIKKVLVIGINQTHWMTNKYWRRTFYPT